MKTLKVLFITITLCAFGCVPTAVTDVTAPRTASSEETVLECNDASGNQLECETEATCCPGFYCGAEPSKSQRKKFCIYDPTNQPKKD